MSKDYDVGFGKPPKHTRFKKGQSGNPKGRPKGTKNLKTDLQEELDEPIRLREGGREKQVSKQRAMVKSLLAKAIKGDARAANTMTNLAVRLLEQDDPGEDTSLSNEERDVVEVLRQRITRAEASHRAAPDKAKPRRRRLRQLKRKQKRQSDA